LGRGKQAWLEEHGVFSAWEKHSASVDFVAPRGHSRGHSDESRGSDHNITRDLNRRLQGEEFVYPDDDKWYRVLVVRWSEEFDPPQNVVLCYEARLADPHANQTHSSYISRMSDECFPASIEEVDDWIERSPKRARIE